jgi:hypothetical protein
MSDKKVNTTSEDVKKSVSSIYSELLNKRRAEREIRIEQKRLEKESKMREKEEDSKSSDSENDKELTKKEKREAELDSWKDIVVGLTGDDLEYIKPKKGKKKYKKWIDEDTGENVVLTDKPKKKKKKNFHKEFEPELNMLKLIVADQNKFTADLQKRYQIAAGPNTRDAMPLNKTMVELASVVNNSRSNSLGVLREIGNIKKTIADLYMKQFKLDTDGSGKGDGFGSQDLGLMGSSLAQSMFGNAMAPTAGASMTSSPVSLGNVSVGVPVSNASQSEDMVFKRFDPNSWDGDGLNAGSVVYEAIPHTVVVEWHKDNDKARFKAIRNDTGEELVGCPVPSCSIKGMDVDNKVAKDVFDQVYQLEII